MNFKKSNLVFIILCVLIVVLISVIGVLAFFILKQNNSSINSVSSAVASNSSEQDDNSSNNVNDASNTANISSTEIVVEPPIVKKSALEFTHDWENEIAVPENTKICYLTFDDGPSDNTLEILKILDKYGAKATFFVIGNDKLDYIENIYNEGHTIGLHTDTHRYNEMYTDTDAYYKDLFSISDKVYEKIGVRSNIIRFPGGSSNTQSMKYAKGIMTTLTQDVQAKGFVYADWNVDSGDATKNGVPVETLLKNIKKDAKSDRICVLMHDTRAKDTTVDALPQIIEYLSEEGYVFLGLSENSKQFHHKVSN